eukprot:1192911-Prorocentrum_minimum.AAC.1
MSQSHPSCDWFVPVADAPAPRAIGSSRQHMLPSRAAGSSLALCSLFFCETASLSWPPSVGCGPFPFTTLHRPYDVRFVFGLARWPAHRRSAGSTS